MIKKIALSLFFLSYVVLINAQTKGAPVTIGDNYVINSKVLNQDRKIQIYLPDSYATSKEKYPVLYVLDGQWFFSSGVSVQKALRTPDAIPEMIVVGIINSDSLRYTLFSDESDKFTTFLKDEVISFVDSKFRTNKERIIFGWESSAYYIGETILKNNNLFTGAITSNGGYAPEKMVKEFKSNKDIYLYVANSRKDIFNISYTEEFHKFLKKYNPKNLKWKYELFNDEVHETLAHLAMYKGLKHYYHNYDDLVFESIKEFEDRGGIDYINTYFKERKERFGADEEIEEATKNILVWLAWNRDNIQYFNLFAKEFKGILENKRHNNAYWKNRFGQFYLKHNDYKNAINFFKTGISKFPNSDFQKDMERGLKEAKNKL